MIYIIIILSLTIIFILFKYLNILSKYKMLKSVVQNIISEYDNTLRLGYYSDPCTQGGFTYTGIVTVREINKYTNGDCKVKIENVEITNLSDSKINKISANEFVRSRFSSIMKSSDITWLDSDVEIKEIRKHKIEKLKNVFK